MRLSQPFDKALYTYWGFYAVLCGAAAIIAVFALLSGIYAPPEGNLGTEIGALAGEMRRAAWRGFLGLEQPVPDPEPISLLTYGQFVGPVLAVIAIILALISTLKQEQRIFAKYAVAMGISAVFLQFLWWVALLIVGVILIITIIQNLGEFFSF